MRNGIKERIRVLSPEKRKLFHRRLKYMKIEHLDAYLKIKPLDKEKFYPAELAEFAGPNFSDKDAAYAFVTGEVSLLPNRFILDIRKNDIDIWNASEMVEIFPMPEIEKIKTVVRYIIEYHDGLRLRLHREENEWKQIIISPQAELPVAVVDFSEVPEFLQKEMIEQKAASFQKITSLAENPVIFVAYYLGDNRPGRLQITINHALADGYSFWLLLQDFYKAYFQLMLAGKIALPPKSTSLKRWAEYLDEYAQSDELRSIELDFWLSIPQKLKHIPVDFPKGIGNNIFESERVVYNQLLTEDENRSLADGIKHKNIQLIVILMTAMVACIGKWAESSSVLVDYTFNGRFPLNNEIDLSRTLGWFAFLAPIHFDINQGSNSLAILEIVRKRLSSIPKGGLGYGCLRYLCKDKATVERMNNIPRPELTFNYFNSGFGLEGDDLPKGQSGYIKMASEYVGKTEGDNMYRGRLLDLVVFDSENGLFSRWHYSINVHKTETVERISNLYKEELLSLINSL